MDNRIDKYSRTGALVIGVLQISLGALLMILQIPLYTLPELVVPALGAVGFWCGIFFMVCGGLTLWSWKHNTRGFITAVMAMDILATIIALGGIVTIAFLVVVDSVITAGTSEEVFKTSLGLNATQAVLCFLEFVLAIVGSALCCAGVCGASDQRQVIYVTNGPGGQTQQVIVVGKQAGSYPHAGLETGAYTPVGDQTGAYTPVGDQTGAFTPVGDQAGPFPPVGDQTGPNVQVGQQTELYPQKQ